jgi:hypothetical protein
MFAVARTANIKGNLLKEQKILSTCPSEYSVPSACPKGCCLSFSDPSPEIEKKNQLCALCASRAPRAVN